MRRSVFFRGCESVALTAAPECWSSGNANRGSGSVKGRGSFVLRMASVLCSCALCPLCRPGVRPLRPAPSSER